MRADGLTTATVAPSPPQIRPARPLVYVALGDSATSGVGDSCDLGQPRGWSRMLAAGLTAAGHDLSHHVLAREGARAADVISEQLGPALDLAPDLVTLLVGGNDVLRGDFDPYALERDIEHLVNRIRERGACVIMLRLHDPTRVVPMPASLARVMRRRVAAVNVVVDAVASRSGALLVDPASDERCYEHSSWHVDRMHPSTQGHLLLAGLVAQRLADRGIPIAPLGVNPQPSVGRLFQAAWMLRNGVPWALKRSVDLLPTLTVLALREAVASA